MLKKNEIVNMSAQEIHAFMKKLLEFIEYHYITQIKYNINHIQELNNKFRVYNIKYKFNLTEYKDILNDILLNYTNLDFSIYNNVSVTGVNDKLNKLINTFLDKTQLKTTETPLNILYKLLGYTFDLNTITDTHTIRKIVNNVIINCKTNYTQKQYDDIINSEKLYEKITDVKEYLSMLQKHNAIDTINLIINYIIIQKNENPIEFLDKGFDFNRKDYQIDEAYTDILNKISANILIGYKSKAQKIKLDPIITQENNDKALLIKKILYLATMDFSWVENNVVKQPENTNTPMYNYTKSCFTPLDI
jgi:hypothetical protein